jgi:hypothetical protein
MASRSDSNFRIWSTFWSSIAEDGTRYRHQVRRTHEDEGRIWLTRTEVWPDGGKIHYTVSVEVPESQGKYFFYKLRPQWTNVNEEGRDMYPPEYQSGFINLEARDVG